MAGGECGSPGDWDSGILRPEIQFFSQNHFHFFDSRWPGGRNHMGMDQYLLIPFLGGWTSIYQLFWCSPGVQGFDTLPYVSWIDHLNRIHLTNALWQRPRQPISKRLRWAAALKRKRSMREDQEVEIHRGLAVARLNWWIVYILYIYIIYNNHSN